MRTDMGAIAIALTLVACTNATGPASSGGGSPGARAGGSGAGSAASAAPRQRPAAGTVAVLGSVLVDNRDTYVHELGVTIERDRYAVVSVVPATGEVVVLETFDRPSYAKIWHAPHTIGERLFVSSSSGALPARQNDVFEYDAGSLKPGQLTICCTNFNDDQFTVLGDAAYGTKDLSGLGTDFKGLHLVRHDQAETVVGPAPTAPRRFAAIGKRLYAWSLDHEGETPVVNAYTVDPTTASFEPLLESVDIADSGRFGSFDFVFDDRRETAYIVRTSKELATLEIHEWPLAGDARLALERKLETDESFSAVDAVEGKLLLNWFRGPAASAALVLVDTSSGSFEPLQLPFSNPLNSAQLFVY